VAAGFRSPLFILGIGKPRNFGFRAPVPIFNYGGTPGTSYGFRTPLPFWNIGTTEYVPPPVVEVRRGGTGIHARLLQEDEEILAVIMAYMSTKH
jgi:hypothetical protein